MGIFISFVCFRLSLSYDFSHSLSFFMLCPQVCTWNDLWRVWTMMSLKNLMFDLHTCVTWLLNSLEWVYYSLKTKNVCWSSVTPSLGYHNSLAMSLFFVSFSRCLSVTTGVMWNPCHPSGMKEEGGVVCCVSVSSFSPMQQRITGRRDLEKNKIYWKYMLEGDKPC